MAGVSDREGETSKTVRGPIRATRRQLHRGRMDHRRGIDSTRISSRAATRHDDPGEVGPARERRPLPITGNVGRVALVARCASRQH